MLLALEMNVFQIRELYTLHVIILLYSTIDSSSLYALYRTLYIATTAYKLS